MRPQIAEYQNGDRIEDGAGSVGYVRECKGANGPYLKAYVSRGPRIGEWVWPERLGRPLIDWTEDGQREVCVDCERTFKGGKDEHGLRRIHCRTCDREHAARERQQGVDAGPSHGFGSSRPRVYRREGA